MVTLEEKLTELIERYFRVAPHGAARSDAQSIIRELEHFGFRLPVHVAQPEEHHAPNVEAGRSSRPVDTNSG
jgi:hypothetical protein